jgi:GNAT superfamily N-acetyltransferase
MVLKWAWFKPGVVQTGRGSNRSWFKPVVVQTCVTRQMASPFTSMTVPVFRVTSKPAYMNHAEASLSIRWAEQSALAVQVADFFCAHANADYISHAELQSGRALAPGCWHPDVREMIHAQAQRILKQSTHDGTTDGIACAWLDGKLVGVAFVSFNTTAQNGPFAILEDLIVTSTVRGMGIGQQFIEWIAQRTKGYGIKRLFLESGLSNAGAHEFFARAGFQQTSIVMMRDL